MRLLDETIVDGEKAVKKKPVDIILKGSHGILNMKTAKLNATYSETRMAFLY